MHKLLLNVNLWHTTSCISLFKGERWGKFDFVCELWSLEGKEAHGGKIIWAFPTWKRAVLVLNAAHVILGGYEQMNKLLWNNINGELAIWSKERQNCASCYARAHVWHTTKFTYQLRLVTTCLLTWTFVSMVCLVTTFQGESAFCFVPSSVLGLDSLREASVLVAVTRPLLSYFPKWDGVWEMLLCLRLSALSPSSICEKGKI